MLNRLRLFLVPLLLIGTAAAAQSTAFLTFDANWNEMTSVSPLPLGAQVTINYDTNRLPQCRGTTNSGGPAWNIIGYYQLNGGTVQSFWVAGHSPDGSSTQPVIQLPEGAAGDLALWFQVTNLWGCTEYDSNFGQNYHFSVHTRPTVQFNADWSETVSGPLLNGQAFTLHYDIARLPGCRQTYNGMDTWDVAVQYRFDGGPVTQTSVTAVYGSRRAIPVELVAPVGARTLEMWFKNWDRTGCVSWDSNLGANYVFDLQ